MSAYRQTLKEKSRPEAHALVEDLLTQIIHRNYQQDRRQNTGQLGAELHRVTVGDAEPITYGQRYGQDREGIGGMLVIVAHHLAPRLGSKLQRIADEADAIAGSHLGVTEHPAAEARSQEQQQSNQHEVAIASASSAMR